MFLKIQAKSSCVGISLFLCIKVTCINAWGYRPVLTCLVDSLLAHLYNLVAIPDAATLAEAQYLILFGSDTISSVS